MAPRMAATQMRMQTAMTMRQPGWKVRSPWCSSSRRPTIHRSHSSSWSLLTGMSVLGRVEVVLRGLVAGVLFAEHPRGGVPAGADGAGPDDAVVVRPED